MSIQAMQNLLQEFGVTIGIPSLTLDEDNRCNLVFDDIGISFELSKEQESLYVYSYLGDAPDANREKVYAALLDANYIFRHTRGATLGMEDASKKIILIREHRLDGMRLADFETLVEGFVNLAEYWKKKIRMIITDPNAALPGDDSSIAEAHAMKV